MHNRALPGALAAEAAGKQGKFWEMHDKLFENPKAAHRRELRQAWAERAGPRHRQVQEGPEADQGARAKKVKTPTRSRASTLGRPRHPGLLRQRPLPLRRPAARPPSRSPRRRGAQEGPGQAGRQAAPPRPRSTTRSSPRARPRSEPTRGLGARAHVLAPEGRASVRSTAFVEVRRISPRPWRGLGARRLAFAPCSCAEASSRAWACSTDAAQRNPKWWKGSFFGKCGRRYSALAREACPSTTSPPARSSCW